MKKLYYVLSFIFTCFVLTTFAQEKEAVGTQNPKILKTSVQEIFDELGNGMSTGNIQDISRLFNSQIYLNLSNGISGYYSSNQAYYVLQDFFRVHHVVSFEFSDTQEEERSLYAIGTYNYSTNGKVDTAQVYIALNLSGKKWKITQITIN
jgi:hypothetical protein